MPNCDALIVQTDRLLTQGKVLMYFQVYQKKYDLWIAKINQKSLPKKLFICSDHSLKLNVLERI